MAIVRMQKLRPRDMKRRFPKISSRTRLQTQISWLGVRLPRGKVNHAALFRFVLTRPWLQSEMNWTPPWLEEAHRLMGQAGI